MPSFRPDVPRKSKAKVNTSQNQAQRKDITLAADRDATETNLEKSGRICALQRYRLFKHQKDASPQSPVLSFKLLFTEEDLREVVQEEMAIKDELLGDKSEVSKERLRILDIQYWLLVQKWWHYRSYLKDGPQLRAFELWRSHPRWYMHPVLVEDCAGRLGCCSRGCGCCRHREIDPARKLGVGHCTFECGCCRKARGFDIPKEEMKLLKEQCREDMSSAIRHRIRRVAIWGIFGGSLDNPFDLVDEPPGYGQSLTRKG